MIEYTLDNRVLNGSRLISEFRPIVANKDRAFTQLFETPGCVSCASKNWGTSRTLSYRDYFELYDAGIAFKLRVPLTRREAKLLWYGRHDRRVQMVEGAPNERFGLRMKLTAVNSVMEFVVKSGAPWPNNPRIPYAKNSRCLPPQINRVESLLQKYKTVFVKYLQTGAFVSNNHTMDTKIMAGLYTPDAIASFLYPDKVKNDPKGVSYILGMGGNARDGVPPEFGSDPTEFAGLIPEIQRLFCVLSERISHRVFMETMGEEYISVGHRRSIFRNMIRNLRTRRLNIKGPGAPVLQGVWGLKTLAEILDTIYVDDPTENLEELMRRYVRDDDKEIPF